MLQHHHVLSRQTCDTFDNELQPLLRMELLCWYIWIVINNITTYFKYGCTYPFCILQATYTL